MAISRHIKAARFIAAARCHSQSGAAGGRGAAALRSGVRGRESQPVCGHSPAAGVPAGHVRWRREGGGEACEIPGSQGATNTPPETGGEGVAAGVRGHGRVPAGATLAEASRAGEAILPPGQPGRSVRPVSGVAAASVPETRNGHNDLGPLLHSLHGGAVPAVSRDGPGYGGPFAYRAASPAESDEPAGVAGV